MYKLAGGWRRDKPDSRDFIVKLKRASSVDLTDIDLRKTGFLPEVYNQNRTQACIGMAIAAALEYGRRKEQLPDFAPSKLFIYYNARLEEKCEDKDDGAELRDGMKSLLDYGASCEEHWPFDENKVLIKPSEESYKEAKTNIIKKYSRLIADLKNVQATLSRGFPIIFGLFCFENFDTAEARSTGIIPMPQGKHVGDHAMLMVGIKGTNIIVRNSWGADWGQDGYCLIPCDYIFNDSWAGDFWMIDIA